MLSAGELELQNVLKEAQNMLPVLSSTAFTTQQSRRMLPEVHSAFLNAGFYKIMQPKAYGGLELEFGSQTQLGIVLAQACGSSSWVATLLACHAWILGMFPKQAQDDVWGANPNALIASSFMGDQPKVKKVPEGLLLSGRWKFSSGVDYSDWNILLAHCPDPNDSAKKLSFYVLLPKKDYVIEDVWNSAGMSGTGSNDIVLKEVLIPEHRLLNAMKLTGGQTPGSEINKGYLYQQPMFGTFSFNLIGNVIGLAKGAANVVLESLKARTALSGATVSANQSIKLRVAEALAEISAAQALVERNLQEIILAGKSQQTIDISTRARYRGENGFASKLCVSAVERLLPVLGARGLESENAFQRIWRDINAVSQHIALTWDVQGTIYGSVALGYDCPDPRV
ncbi:MAG: acyl-CoA dehydrogenase family protein [Betaproteobacteria bacterium]|jgi:3-hydroxy-9,10-secoandrosta-1,3,5(10)-triene-9,17-dione monooxygenase